MPALRAYPPDLSSALPLVRPASCVPKSAPIPVRPYCAILVANKFPLLQLPEGGTERGSLP